MNRRGVSLIEVLFAIGVIAVGLLGLIAVLPIALHQAGRGNVADRSLRVAQNAFTEFDIVGMSDDSNWIWRDPGPDGQFETADDALARVSQSKTTFASTKYRGFAIDPLFISSHGYKATAPAVAKPYQFPYDVRVAGPLWPRMERISLQSRLSAAILPWRFLEADYVFSLDDELVFEPPVDKTAPPTQTFFGGAKRSVEGTFSWLVTLAPELDATNSVRDTYLLSLVVFHRRDLTLGNANERVVTVQSFSNGGLGGGDATLRTLIGVTGVTADELDVKSGDWLMLMGNLTTPMGAGLSPILPVFRWYKIVESEGAARDVSGNGTQFELDVTLQGSDWPAALTVPVGANQPTRTQAALFRNVVGVYERSTRLQPTSLWTP